MKPHANEDSKKHLPTWLCPFEPFGLGNDDSCNNSDCQHNKNLKCSIAAKVRELGKKGQS